MNSHLVRVVHLVELVDAADTIVRQHQRARLQTHLSRLHVATHAHRETGRRGRLARSVHRARRNAVDVLQELRLRRRRVAHDTDVDVAADAAAVRRLLVDAADQLQQQSALDVLVAVDTRRQRAAQLLI